MSLQEGQAGAFWCHEFQWPMKRRNNVKKMSSGSFQACLIDFWKLCLFQYNEWIKLNQTKHFCYLFTCMVEFCTISTFIVVVLHELSRSHRLHKHTSAEFKLQLPNTWTPLTVKSSYLCSAAFEQSLCLPNEVKDKFLDENFWWIWALFSIQVQY